MRNKLTIIAALFIALTPWASFAQVWAGPGPEPCFSPACTPDAPVVPPVTERTVCLGDFGCLPVGYSTAGLFTIAVVKIPNGYPVAGISGACLPGWDCPGIRDDADRDLLARLQGLHRFKRFLGQ
ncbi:hypothetical protein [Candidatus Contendibacter odensensis]|uniref:hypothetical protein n=1 Tax=Candidatus Contendibacter odensensis TaxID=1400860 RepID=UPI00054DD85E|nr:hypothetical protein [Candidatus Contendobacter odensis]